MLNSLFNEKEINAELIATAIFAIFSGLYLSLERGLGELINTVILWMFPASIMFFLTLLIVKVIETAHKRKVKNWKYLDMTRR